MSNRDRRSTRRGQIISWFVGAIHICMRGRTFNAFESILPTSCLLRCPWLLNTGVPSSCFPFFLRLPPPPAPGLTVLPSTSGRHHLPTAPSVWWRPITESGSARVQVWGLFGNPETT